jgi:hypothetical protein
MTADDRDNGGRSWLAGSCQVRLGIKQVAAAPTLPPARIQPTEICIVVQCRAVPRLASNSWIGAEVGRCATVAYAARVH